MKTIQADEPLAARLLAFLGRELSSKSSPATERSALIELIELVGGSGGSVGIIWPDNDEREAEFAVVRGHGDPDPSLLFRWRNLPNGAQGEFPDAGGPDEDDPGR